MQHVEIGLTHKKGLTLISLYCQKISMYLRAKNFATCAAKLFSNINAIVGLVRRKNPKGAEFPGSWIILATAFMQRNKLVGHFEK